MAAVMVVGLSAISATVVNAGCVGYTIDCGNGHVEGGSVCGSSAAAMMERVMEVANEIC